MRLSLGLRVTVTVTPSESRAGSEVLPKVWHRDGLCHPACRCPAAGATVANLKSDLIMMIIKLIQPQVTRKGRPQPQRARPRTVTPKVTVKASGPG